VLTLPIPTDYGITTYRLSGLSNVEYVSFFSAYDMAYNRPDWDVPGGWVTSWWGGQFGVAAFCDTLGCINRSNDTHFYAAVGLTYDPVSADWIVYLDNRTRFPANRCNEGLSAPDPCAFYPDVPASLTVRVQPQANQTPTIAMSTTAVPEPSVWAMMTMGFGLAGAALRHRQRNDRRFGRGTGEVGMAVGL